METIWILERGRKKKSSAAPISHTKDKVTEEEVEEKIERLVP